MQALDLFGYEDDSAYCSTCKMSVKCSVYPILCQEPSVLPQWSSWDTTTLGLFFTVQSQLQPVLLMNGQYKTNPNI